MTALDLEEACKAVCYLCSDGRPVGFDDVTGRYYHKDDSGYYYNAGWCRASNIRELAAPPANEE